MPLTTNGKACGKGAPITTNPIPLFQMLAEGWGYRGIALELNLSESQVRSRVRRYLQKLNVHSSCHAIAIMFRKGLLK